MSRKRATSSIMGLETHAFLFLPAPQQRDHSGRLAAGRVFLENLFRP